MEKMPGGGSAQTAEAAPSDTVTITALTSTSAPNATATGHTNPALSHASPNDDMANIDPALLHDMSVSLIPSTTALPGIINPAVPSVPFTPTYDPSFIGGMGPTLNVTQVSPLTDVVNTVSVLNGTSVTTVKKPRKVCSDKGKA